jgi:diaminopimelate decarboxylase
VGEGVLATSEFAGFPRQGGLLHCEQAALPELAERWDTPLYVYSAGAIRGAYREMARALAPHPHLIAYSVKANGNLAILRLLAAEGAGADIVSLGELHRAHLAGIPGERIVFSGVGKTERELTAALEAQILCFNVESEGELETLSRLAAASGYRAPIALRVNPAIDSPTPHAYTRTGHAGSKFGIPIADALRIYRHAVSLPGIHVRGIDLHIGSQILTPEPYALALDQVLGVVDSLADEGISLELLDLGGGLGISYREEEGVSATTFAATVLPPLAGRELRLIVEPGRYLVGQAGVLLARVLYVKEGGGKRFLVTDAGMNDLLRPSHYAGFHGVEPVLLHPDRPRVRADVVGPICETGDFLALDREFEELEPGELIGVRAVGAYGFSMASTYNQRPRPAEVLVEGDRATLVRRRETLEDLIACEMDIDT